MVYYGDINNNTIIIDSQEKRIYNNNNNDIVDDDDDDQLTISQNWLKNFIDYLISIKNKLYSTDNDMFTEDEREYIKDYLSSIESEYEDFEEELMYNNILRPQRRQDPTSSSSNDINKLTHVMTAVELYHFFLAFYSKRTIDNKPKESGIFFNIEEDPNKYMCNSLNDNNQRLLSDLLRIDAKFKKKGCILTGFFDRHIDMSLIEIVVNHIITNFFEKIGLSEFIEEDITDNYEFTSPFYKGLYHDKNDGNTMKIQLNPETTDIRLTIFPNIFRLNNTILDEETHNILLRRNKYISTNTSFQLHDDVLEEVLKTAFSKKFFDILPTFWIFGYIELLKKYISQKFKYSHLEDNYRKCVNIPIQTVAIGFKTLDGVSIYDLSTKTLYEGEKLKLLIDKLKNTGSKEKNDFDIPPIVDINKLQIRYNGSWNNINFETVSALTDEQINYITNYVNNTYLLEDYSRIWEKEKLSLINELISKDFKKKYGEDINIISKNIRNQELKMNFNHSSNFYWGKDYSSSFS